METHGSPTKAIETIEHVATNDIMTDNSANVTEAPMFDVSPVVKHEANGTPKDASKAQSLETPLENPAGLEITDEEDALEIFTALPPNPDDGESFQVGSSTRPYRPDFSSTSEDEADEIPYEEPKLLLQSDVNRSSSHQFLSQSRMLRQSIDHEDRSEDVGYADPRSYTRCVACSHDHRHCDRRMPTCQRCQELNQECIYHKRRKNETTSAATETTGSARKTSLKPSPADNRSSSSVRMMDPKSSQSLPMIAWQESDVSHSQKKCPKSIINLISNHKNGFEETQLSGLWGIGKTVYAESGKDCVFVDEESNEDVFVARYTYGLKKQFFVAWLPAEDASHPSVPVICKFRVYNNERDVSRDGRMWRPLRWRTWYPENNTYHGREVFRLVCTSTSKMKAPARAYEVIDLDKSVKTASKPSWTNYNHRNQSSEDDVDEQDTRRSAKRLRADSGLSWNNTSKMYQQRGSKRQFSSRDMSSATVDRAGLTAKTMQTGHLVREPQRKGPPLTVVFKNSTGGNEGSYPYDECDTAEKLFDVACVTRIAQIEPPATRLLKVEFDGGGHGIIRPDSVNDFEKIFKGELQKLMDARSSKAEMTVTVSAYR